MTSPVINRPDNVVLVECNGEAGDGGEIEGVNQEEEEEQDHRGIGQEILTTFGMF